MGRIKKSPAARADLIDIWQYIADDSSAEADRFLDTIEDVLLLITESPKMGKRKDELALQIRSFPVGDYRIFYRELDAGKGIEVVRVLNAAQDINAVHFE